MGVLKNIDDWTNPDIYDGGFNNMVGMLLEDIQWQIERESSHQPLYGSQHRLNNGVVITHTNKTLFNGFSNMEEIPSSDYLVNNFSVSAQFDKLTDISQRVVQSRMAQRQSGQTRLVWAAQDSKIKLERNLYANGLLMLLTTWCSWI
jgi:hypothetical protein